MQAVCPTSGAPGPCAGMLNINRVCGVVSHMHTIAGVLPAHTPTHPWIEGCARSAHSTVGQGLAQHVGLPNKTIPRWLGHIDATRTSTPRQENLSRNGWEPSHAGLMSTSCTSTQGLHVQPTHKLHSTAQPQRPRSVLVPADAPCTNKLQPKQHTHACKVQEVLGTSGSCLDAC